MRQGGGKTDIFYLLKSVSPLVTLVSTFYLWNKCLISHDSTLLPSNPNLPNPSDTLSLLKERLFWALSPSCWVWLVPGWWQTVFGQLPPPWMSHRGWERGTERERETETLRVVFGSPMRDSPLVAYPSPSSNLWTSSTDETTTLRRASVTAATSLFAELERSTNINTHTHTHAVLEFKCLSQQILRVLWVMTNVITPLFTLF